MPACPDKCRPIQGHHREATLTGVVYKKICQTLMQVSDGNSAWNIKVNTDLIRISGKDTNCESDITNLDMSLLLADRLVA